MKVGTDGVLLGAWARVDQASTVLDIGTGSGLLAMMIAQQSATLATRIHAIDVDEAAVREATDNVLACPWYDRIEVYLHSVQDFAETSTRIAGYDLQICNPPFFAGTAPGAVSRHGNSRWIARHDDRLPQYELFASAARLRSPGGRLCLILPYTEFERSVRLAGRFGWYLHRRTAVRMLAGRPFKRVLIEFGTCEIAWHEETLTLEEIHHQKTEAFRSLTADFLPGAKSPVPREP